ncbi:hypothetical protein, partial [Bradyrhizobium sp. BRP19]|uniref:hypothetical protein n=1 Tax=Bradyrhizobium sp. BRP19 TaxID=2793823 RepID=UPI001CD3F15D
PASCSFNTAIICSSVNLARFICPSFFGPDSNSFWRKYAVAGQAANASFVAVWVQADHFLAAQKVIQIATAVRRHRTICTKYCGFGR